MKQQILELLEAKKYSQLKKEFTEMLVPDIAELFEEIDNPLEVVKVFKLLPKDIGAEVFSYVDSSVQEALITAMSDKEIAFLIEDMFIDDAVDFMEEMPANIVEKVLKISTPQTRQTINKLLCYKEDSAGSVMTTEFGP